MCFQLLMCRVNVDNVQIFASIMHFWDICKNTSNLPKKWLKRGFSAIYLREFNQDSFFPHNDTCTYHLTPVWMCFFKILFANLQSCSNTGWSLKTVDCNFFLTDPKNSKSAKTQWFSKSLYMEVLVIWCFKIVRCVNFAFRSFSNKEHLLHYSRP